MINGIKNWLSHGFRDASYAAKMIRSGLSEYKSGAPSFGAAMKKVARSQGYVDSLGKGVHGPANPTPFKAFNGRVMRGAAFGVGAAAVGLTASGMMGGPGLFDTAGTAALLGVAAGGVAAARYGFKHLGTGGMVRGAAGLGAVVAGAAAGASVGVNPVVGVAALGGAALYASGGKGFMRQAGRLAASPFTAVHGVGSLITNQQAPMKNFMLGAGAIGGTAAAINWMKSGDATGGLHLPGGKSPSSPVSVMGHQGYSVGHPYSMGGTY